MRFTALFAPDGLSSPDGMAGAGRYVDRFDDGLVHNHHWAVTGDDEYRFHGRDAASHRRPVLAEVSPFESRRGAAQADDRHDDGLVHNHEWAVTAK